MENHKKGYFGKHIFLRMLLFCMFRAPSFTGSQSLISGWTRSGEYGLDDDQGEEMWVLDMFLLNTSCYVCFVEYTAGQVGSSFLLEEHWYSLLKGGERTNMDSRMISLGALGRMNLCGYMHSLYPTITYSLRALCSWHITRINPYVSYEDSSWKAPMLLRKGMCWMRPSQWFSSKLRIRYRYDGLYKVTSVRGLPLYDTSMLMLSLYPC